MNKGRGSPRSRVLWVPRTWGTSTGATSFEQCIHTDTHTQTHTQHKIAKHAHSFSLMHALANLHVHLREPMQHPGHSLLPCAISNRAVSSHSCCSALRSSRLLGRPCDAAPLRGEPRGLTRACWALRRSCSCARVLASSAALLWLSAVALPLLHCCALVLRAAAALTMFLYCSRRVGEADRSMTSLPN